MQQKYHKLITAVVVLLFTSSCHVPRFFFWNFADIKDHKKFSSLPVHNDPQNTFDFYSSAEAKVSLPDTLFVKKKLYPWQEAMKKSKTVAFLVIRNDSILFEEYFAGYDQASVVPSFSMSKSYISALIGIAIEEGYIKSVDDKVTNYVPELPSDQFSDLSIEHLLDMQSGIEYREGYTNPFGDVAKYYYGRNLKKYLAELNKEKEPGTQFRYKSIDSQLLGIILQNTTGRSPAQYLEEKIWQPLGMEFPASWSIDSKKHQTIKAFCCLNAVARDYAKFGRLYLNKGNWNGNQIVPEDWVKKSTTFSAPKNRFIYSYQWWHNANYTIEEDSIPTDPLTIVKKRQTVSGETVWVQAKPGNDFFANGLLGQYIYVYPEKNIIIVRLGKKTGHVKWESLMLQVAKMN
ncbi:MAG: beta-lactamase family protein [Bacteroidales bacterium]|nr:beta-lactamase family protein [Bacteroidales bacterium]